MKTITLKSLHLTNFKGIRRLQLNDVPLQTYVYGDNGTGKTTLFDAFVWLLFGKDSTDRKDFEIKTLDANNNVIPKIDHEIEGVIDVDGEQITLRRIFSEKWVKRKGALEAEFTGNETQFFWNGVPQNAGEYASKINALVEEKVFKMITNPSAFNSLKWQDQRSVLIDMTGEISNEDIASGNEEFTALLSKLNGKSFDDYKKQVKASVSKSKKDLQTIPTRIDEVERGKPEAVNFSSLKKQLEEKNAELESLNLQVSDKLKAQQADLDKQKQIQQDIYKLQTEISTKKHDLQVKASETFSTNAEKPREIQHKINALDSEIKANETLIEARQIRIKSANHRIASLDEKINALRTKWDDENSKTFVMDENECNCPTCKRAFEADDIAEKQKDLEQHFISSKKATLDKIKKEGQDLTGEKTLIASQVADMQKDIDEAQAKNKTLWEQRADLSQELKAFDTSKDKSTIFTELFKTEKLFFDTKQNEIDKLQTALDNRPGYDDAELKAQINTVKTDIDAIKRELSKEAQIEASNARINELLEEEKTLAQAQADLEKDLFIIEAFEKEKSNRIEASVNSRFNLVNFKLFETQINGSEIPTCKALINGVPFSDANTASKINAGLDIINTLCNHYQANAPIFIDNRESVIDLIPTASQIINLVVSEEDKALRIEDRPLSDTEYALKKVFESSEEAV